MREPKTIKLIINSMCSILGAPIRSFLVMLGIILAVVLYSSGSMISNTLLTQNTMVHQNFSEDVILITNPTDNLSDFMEKNYSGCEYYRYSFFDIKLSGYKNIEDYLSIKIVGVPIDYLNNSILSCDIENSLEIIKFMFGYEFSNFDYEIDNCVMHINHSYARILFGDNYEIGKSSIQINDNKFILKGILEDTSDVVRNVRKINSNDSHEITIYVPYTTVEALSSNVSYYEIYRFGNVNIDKIVKNIKEKFYGVDLYTKSMIVKEISEQNASTKQLLFGIMIFISIISCFVITITMLFNIRERLFEIGIKLAIGSNKDDIAFSFMIESIVIGIIGSLIGILVSFFIVIIFSLINYINTDIFIFKINIINDILFPMSFAVLIATITSVIPAIIAASTNVISCLKVE